MMVAVQQLGPQLIGTDRKHSHVTGGREVRRVRPDNGYNDHSIM
jgi:hypothetical protein